MPRPFTGPHSKPQEFRQLAEPTDEKMPKESWWASGLSREAFAERARAEAHRLRGSKGERWAGQLESGSVERYFTKVGR